jgi:hypothetical protein
LWLLLLAAVVPAYAMLAVVVVKCQGLCDLRGLNACLSCFQWVGATFLGGMPRCGMPIEVGRALCSPQPEL